MLTVKFYDTIDDALLEFAVIISKHNDKWVFCKHKERDTYEVPGGHREVNESGKKPLVCYFLRKLKHLKQNYIAKWKPCVYLTNYQQNGHIH